MRTLAVALTFVAIVSTGFSLFELVEFHGPAVWFVFIPQWLPTLGLDVACVTLWRAIQMPNNRGAQAS